MDFESADWVARAPPKMPSDFTFEGCECREVDQHVRPGSHACNLTSLARLTYLRDERSRSARESGPVGESVRRCE